MTAGDLSTFIIYAIFVGGNLGGLAGTIGQLVQVPSRHHKISGFFCSSQAGG